jgi:hypothetical protein
MTFIQRAGWFSLNGSLINSQADLSPLRAPLHPLAKVTRRPHTGVSPID